MMPKAMHLARPGHARGQRQDADDDGGQPEPQEVHARHDDLQDEQHHGQDEPVPDARSRRSRRKASAYASLLP